MGYTPKFLIDNVSVKLPYGAFAILRKSWEMIVNPDVVVIRRLLIMNAHCFNQRFQNFFERDWNLTWWTSCDPSLKQRKIFGSRLLSLFSVSAVYSFLKYLRYTTNRQANNFEELQHKFRLWSPRRDLFSDPMRNRNPCLGREQYCRNHWLKHINLF